MPIATIKYNLPDEQNEFDIASKAGDMASAIWSLKQDLFRPARKHGYPDSYLQSLIEKLDSLAGAEGDGGTELVSKLEEMFYSILEEHGVEDLDGA